MPKIQFAISDLKLYSNFHLQNIYYTIFNNYISAWIGNNGSGKSSLMNVLVKNQKLKNNMVFLNKKDLNKISYKQLSQCIAYVPQFNTIYGETSVYDFISVGRLPHTNFMGFLTKKDKEIIAKTMQLLKIWELRTKKISNLSGGQKQKVIIANALVQQTPIIALDEPLNHLDVQAKEDIINLIKTLKMKFLKTIIIILHDFQTAANLADQIVYFHQGTVPVVGAPKEVITTANLKKYFNVERTIVYENEKIQILD